MTSSNSKRPWYHLTPGRFFIGLLAVQVFLFLSERLQWFPFNEHKGWTVLIAVAVVGVAVAMMLIWGLACLCLRRRFQFGFRSLLVFLVALSVPLGWFAWEVERARRQSEAVEVIVKTGGGVFYDYRLDEDFSAIDGGKPTAPAWLRNVLGDDFFCAVMVVVCDTEFDDDDAMHLQEVTDAGLVHLEDMTHVTYLLLDDTQVTDNDLARLRKMTQLKELGLDGTQVTDDGLAHLRGMTKLTVLSLVGTQTTDEGVNRLQHALPNCV